MCLKHGPWGGLYRVGGSPGTVQAHTQASAPQCWLGPAFRELTTSVGQARWL